MGLTKTCLDIAAEFGIALIRESTGWWKGLCPIHSDHIESLRLAPDGSHWRCMACQHGGDSIELYRFLTGCSFEDAQNMCAIKQDIATTLFGMLQPRDMEYEAELDIAFCLKHALRTGVPLEAIDQALGGEYPCNSLRQALRLAMPQSVTQ